MPNLKRLFPTPLWISTVPRFEEHKQAFLDAVESYRRANPAGQKRSGIGGYQSPMQLHSQAGLRPLFERVCDLAHEAGQALRFKKHDTYITSSWVNYNESKGSMNARHVHSEVFSGVFYLLAPPGSGKLCLDNAALNGMWPGGDMVETPTHYTLERFKILPEEGKLLLWPSYLPHSVEPNTHDQLRISISFNIMTIPKSREAPAKRSQSPPL